MDKREFIDKMYALKMKCAILDDHLVNPNEIILFVHKKTKSTRNMIERLPRKISDLGKERYIRVFSYREVGIEQWEPELEKTGKKINEYVTLLAEEDICAVYLYYAFHYVQTEHWLYKNILSEIGRRIDGSEEAMAVWLAEYLSKKKYSVKVKRIVNVRKPILSQMTLAQKSRLRLRQFFLKVQRRLVIKTLHIKGRVHNALTRRKYIEGLRSEKIIDDNWDVMNRHGEGASGCTLLKVREAENTFFIKGNELPVYQGIRNEIHAQQKLLESVSEEETWFLPMNGCDSSHRWIRYEFKNIKLLSNYMEQHLFSREELDKLGEYLVCVLDRLFELKMVHNDLRQENIMVQVKGDGSLDNLILIDFGCSYFDGSSPWKTGTFWGDYLSKAVCGKMRYNEMIVDDAASAWQIYLKAGGNSEDIYAQEIKERIGRLFFTCE